MAPVLLNCHRGVEGGNDSTRNSFQVLGFDVMLDRSFKPFLLEINNNPSLCIDEALLLEPDDTRLAERARPGRPRERGEGKVCQCMDMAQPHTHRTSMVDLVVKTTAMVGIFRLLEQMKHGNEAPEVDDYIPIDASNDDFWHLMQRVEDLFHRSGGGQKAFTSYSLRRHLGPLCGHGALEKHDLDTMAIRFRSTNFVSHDRAAKPDSLRLFDFLDLLTQAGRKAFPALGGRDLVEQVLAVIGS